ncbi:hypothetical protein [Rothia sp. P5766]|uniref:hypothetical protein n=1 Tax=unclassified Rothia (in: high G+C Gram-positive bacteria) TaxID=2689056 RepID=UPI003AEA9265
MTKNHIRKTLLSITICSQLLLTGCGTMNTPQSPESTATPSANEAYKNLYTTVTLAASANGDYEKFKWKHGMEDFPYKESSWADLTPISCDATHRRIEVYATMLAPSPTTTTFKEKAEKVRNAWEAKGLKVRNVWADDAYFSIVTDLPDQTVVVYSVSDRAEIIDAETQCLPGLEDDQKSTAEVIPAEIAQ